MTRHFRAFRIHRADPGVRAGIEHLTLDDLSSGEVVIRAAWSGVNYKDALAGTGTGPILRRYPLVGGIDVAGTVESSRDDRFRPGDKVLVNGCGLSEVHDGGYSEVVRVPADWVVALPHGLSLYESMAIGTAGFTAALAIQRMEQLGQTPDNGPILVTGATGGVGGYAIDLFAGQGYEVVALTGKPEQTAYLQSLGTTRILDRREVRMGDKPLESAEWGGAVDCVGGDTLAWLTRTVRPRGNIVSIGMAGGSNLNTTVMPFILRGISLLGISSANCPMDLRRLTWQRLASDLKPRRLDLMITGEITLDHLPESFKRLLAGTQTGRTVVRIDPSVDRQPQESVT